MALHYNVIPTLPVVPAKAGTQFDVAVALKCRSNGNMDPGFRRDDGVMLVDTGFRRDDGVMLVETGFRRDDGLMRLSEGTGRWDV